jgi:hypothetical protein
MATLNVKKFPDDIYGRLQALAEREHRSVAQQVIHLLARATEEPAKLSILELRGLGKGAWKDVSATDHVAAERDSWNRDLP